MVKNVVQNAGVIVNVLELLITLFVEGVMINPVRKKLRMLAHEL